MTSEDADCNVIAYELLPRMRERCHCRKIALLVLGLCVACAGCANRSTAATAPISSGNAAAAVSISEPSTAAEYVKRGRAREEHGDLLGAIADYQAAGKLDQANLETYGQLVLNASLARNRLAAEAEAKASKQDPKFGAVYHGPAPAGYDLITATYSAGDPDRDSQTQVIQRHHFVDGKYVKTEEIYRVTEYGVPGLQGTNIWRDRYLVSDLDLGLLDLWTGKTRRMGQGAPPPNHMYVLIDVQPEGLMIENLYTTPRSKSAAIGDAKARNNLFRLTTPDGELEKIPRPATPPWPNQPSAMARPNSWEISPDGNRRAMHPFPGEKPGPEDGLWLYDWKLSEKKFLAGSFYDSSTAPGRDPCMVWLDNDRFVTLRPDGEVILVQWDGTITSLGQAPKPGPGKNDLVLDRDGAGRILIVKYWLGTDTTSLVDVDAKTVTKATNWKLGHDWEVSLPMGPNTPVELRHAGVLITKTITAAGPPLVSPDGLNVAMPDYDKLQNGDAFQKGYLRIYSLVTKDWVDFPATERPIAWTTAAPEMK